MVSQWLTMGSFDGQPEVEARVRAERREHLAADGRIAVVESTSRFAVTAAYGHADVVVAVNPAFRFAGGTLHRKITVCQRVPGLVDLGKVVADLAEVEPGWGGSPVIVGSPQGVSASTPTAAVVATVERHLIGGAASAAGVTL